MPKIGTGSNRVSLGGINRIRNTRTREPDSIKAWQKQALMPLYEKQADYLVRMIKTLEIEPERVLDNIDEYKDRASCHEIILNDLSGARIQTHMNPHGYEKEYTEHQAARGVGRDERVKIIWDILQKKLRENPELTGIKPFKPGEYAKSVKLAIVDPAMFERRLEEAINRVLQTHDREFVAATFNRPFAEDEGIVEADTLMGALIPKAVVYNPNLRITLSDQYDVGPEEVEYRIEWIGEED